MTNKPEGMRMKRLFILILALLTALMMASCKKAEEPAPAAPPEPSDEAKLLAEIRDMMKEQRGQ